MLVVATPCPLILAVPVALVAGLSRAAHFGVLIKGAKPLEALARIQTLILDKTGTLTDGRPQIVSIDTQGDMSEDEVLHYAAALDQASKHPIAQAIVAAARERGAALPVPENVVETPGEGVSGTIEGRKVVVGGAGFVASQVGAADVEGAVAEAGSVVVALGVDGKLMGHLVMADALRSGTAELLAGLRRLGVGRILLATGDRRAVAETVTEGLGLDAVRADLTPDQKVLLVLTERKNGPVMMVGDGVNDAPALAAADIGVAMGARGAAASAEAADVVLLVDHLDRLLPGIEVAQRSRRIALESVVAGIGLSVLGMIAAAFGYLTPVQGALLQELIDVAVILNALRALRIVPRKLSGYPLILPYQFPVGCSNCNPPPYELKGPSLMSRLSHSEIHMVHRIGWLRAAVLGANDGLVSTASLVVGVAAASAAASEVLIAGLAGLVAGAMSMAAGEYVSVSSQTDAEQADIARERAELADAARVRARGACPDLHRARRVLRSRPSGGRSADGEGRARGPCARRAGHFGGDHGAPHSGGTDLGRDLCGWRGNAAGHGGVHVAICTCHGCIHRLASVSRGSRGGRRSGGWGERDEGDASGHLLGSPRHGADRRYRCAVRHRGVMASLRRRCVRPVSGAPYGRCTA